MTENQKMDALRFRNQMRTLVGSFPSLRGYLDIDQIGFDLDRFSEFADSVTGVHEQAIHAAAFVESVAVGEDREFDFIGAYKAWDAPHHAAFFRWCHSPFYPPVVTDDQPAADD
mgnify:CR=1 FL=1